MIPPEKLKEIYDKLEKRHFEPTLEGCISYLQNVLLYSGQVVIKQRKGDNSEEYKDELLITIRGFCKSCTIVAKPMNDLVQPGLHKVWLGRGVYLAYKK
jgi:hypothetical protein